MNSLTKSLSTNSVMSLDQYREWKEAQVRYVEQLEYYLELFGLPKALKVNDTQKLLGHDAPAGLLGYEELSQDEKVESMLNQLVAIFDLKSVDVTQVSLSVNATQIQFLNLLIQMNQFTILQAYIESQQIDVVMVYVYLLQLKSGSSVNVASTSEDVGSAVGEVVGAGAGAGASQVGGVDLDEKVQVDSEGVVATEDLDMPDSLDEAELVDESTEESDKKKLPFRLPSIDVARLMKYLPWLIILAMLADKCGDDDHSNKAGIATECPPVVDCPPCGYSYPSKISVVPSKQPEKPVKKPELPIVDGGVCEDVPANKPAKPIVDNGDCIMSVDRDVIFPNDFPEYFKAKITRFAGVCLDTVGDQLCDVTGDVVVLKNGNTMLNGQYLSGTAGKCFDPVR